MPSPSTPALLTLALAFTAGSAAAQTADSLPPAVASAFHQAYPKAAILHVSREHHRGKLVYEVESRDGQTRRDLLYSPAGHTIQVEETIPTDSMPAAVRAAVDRDLPGAVIVRVERVTDEAGVSYEVQVRRDGRRSSLTYDGEGARREP